MSAPLAVAATTPQVRSMETATYPGLKVLQFPCLSDNYGFVVIDEATGMTAAIDTPDADVIADVVDQHAGGSLDLILNTHWHPDHAGGNGALKARYGTTIIAPDAEGEKIAVADRRVSDGDEVRIGESVGRVISTPGHTLGHCIYVFDQAGVAFVGDTLFNLGCGRLFEGTPSQMWSSLEKVRALPDDTTIYCAHEYTAANAAFAVSVDPENDQLAARQEEISHLRAKSEPTVPFRLGNDRAVNPFLRADDEALAAHLGMANAAPDAVFAEIRQRKDNFR